MTPEQRERYESEDLAGSVTRREFLQVLAASFAALGAAGCKPRAPKDRIVPLAESPEDYAPGLARWYATTCAGCPSGCGALAKSRDGRPIKLEGNPEHPLSRGGLCARAHASVLDLYDSERLRAPMAGGKASSWAAADAAVRGALEACGREGKAVRVVSGTLGPTARAALEALLKSRPKARQVVYDPLSCAAILEAHRLTHGRRALPHYRFNAAQAIVSFDADFLGTWLSPIEFTRDWASNRVPGQGWERMSWHAQFEPRLSVTGAKADLHVPLRPSEELATVVALGQLVARRLPWKGALPSAAGATSVGSETLAATADMLVNAGRRALVVSGSADAAVQAAVNWLNEMLGAYGTTLDLERPSLQRQGDDGSIDGLIAELSRGEVGAVVFLDSNPVYDHPRGAELAKAMGKAGLTVSLCERRDETAAACAWALPLPHALESWGDAEPVPGVRSLFQPLVSPLFDSRPAVESLLAWAGRREEAYAYLRERWRREVHPHAAKGQGFEAFWDEALRKGAVSFPAPAAPKARFDAGALARLKAARAAAPSGAFELVAYPSLAIGAGRQANNPWLQELPDPISRVAWGNCASFSPADAERLGLVEGRVVRLSAGGLSVELPAQVQPGLPEGVVASALGYGRPGAGKVAANYPMRKLFPIERDLLAGADLFPLARAGAVTVELTGRMSPLAKVQRYDFQTDPILGYEHLAVREMALPDYYKDPRGGRPEEPDESLWPRHKYEGHKWAMAIDLNACTGCAACVVSCQAENNVPVVGKAEMRKSRDMAWLRIDRYYSGSPKPLPANPDVSFQPMLCQHCDNAPCETVCPVLATVHSSEGLNQQVYNRCVGTRYCANNCPYKVRRFNWFDYAHQDLVQNLALNPDVTVRTRGVMEKCSLCVQRISAAKAEAKVAGRPLAEGDVRTACQQSCPAQAIVFGDVNDPASRIARLARDPRGYRVLGELGVGPSVFYQTKVTNKQV